MSTHIHSIISEIRGVPAPGQPECFTDAMFIIEEFVRDGVEHPPELVSDLRSTLIEFASGHRDHPDVGSAIWALSKFQDPELRPFFISEMRHHLAARRHFPIAQAESGLLQLGERGTGYSYSVGESSHDEYFDAVAELLDA